ncbi:Protodermal factor 1, partial [Linum perenne]
LVYFCSSTSLSSLASIKPNTDPTPPLHSKLIAPTHTPTMGEKQQTCSAVAMWVLLAAALLIHNLAVPVMADAAASSHLIGDQKNYYPPDPSSRTPPSVDAGSHTPSTPSHGGSGSPPHHGSPSHGGHHHPTPSNPPSGNCGSPPSTPTPSIPTPSTPTPSIPTPSTPTPIDPSTPPSGGGSYNPSPSPPTGGGGGILTPPTPIIGGSPPTTPFTPPFVIDPNSPFSCNYWRSHPGLIMGLLGWWGTMGNAFGVPSVPGFGASTSLPQALSNTRNDGYGMLYREGTAALLNSMVSNRFAFTTNQVRQNFVTALGSNKAAAAQGQVFKMANEGRLKPRN